MSACGGSGDSPNPPAIKGLNVTPTSVSFISEGGTQTLKITSESPWTLQPSQSGGETSWCSLSTTSGQAGTASVDVRAAANDTYDERNLSLTLSDGKEEKTIVVTQKQKDAILLSSDKVEVDAEGGEFTIEIATNIDFKAEVAPQSQSWLHEETGTRALTTHTLHFRADKNEFTDQREGTIIFTGNGLREEVTVYQTGVSAILLSANRKFLPYSPGKFEVEVKSNREYNWKIESGSEWLHPDQTRAMSSHTLYFRYDENPSEIDGRESKITFTTTDNQSVTLTVVQKAKGKIILADDVTTIPACGGEFLISYDATSEMCADYPAWIETITNHRATRGIESFQLWLRAHPNYNSQARQGTLKIFDGVNPSLSESITLIQEASSVDLKLSCPEGSYKDARSHEFTIIATSNVPYSLEMPEAIKSLGGDRYRVDGINDDHSASYTIAIMVDGRAVKSFTLHQDAPIIPRLDKTEFRIPGDGGVFTVSIRCNSDIKFTLPSDCKWIKMTKKEIGVTVSADTWTFHVDSNASKEQRSVRMGVAGPKGWTAGIEISQDAKTAGIDADGNVTLPNGGELAGLLTQTQKENLVGMAIDGRINGSDVKTLRQMASDYKLVNLDLSKTKLIPDPNTPYYSHYMTAAYPAVISRADMMGHFMFCQTNLKSVKLPEGIKELGYRTFCDTKLTSVTIPEGVTKMGEQCFRGCHNLYSISLPSTLAEIPSMAFFECFSLQSLVIPKGVKVIGDRAFTPRDATSSKGSLSSLSLPEGLESIGDFAFNCQRISTLELPSTLKTLGSNTFKENRQLRSVVFKSSMETLPRGTFEMCSSLSSIKLPMGLKTIGQSALAHTDFQTFAVPEGVTTLDNGALEGMACRTLTLPSSLTRIHDWALGQLYYLPSITIPAKVGYMGRYALGSPCNFKEIHMKPASVPECPGAVFSQDFDYSKCTLYVPRGSKAAYAAHAVWGKFPKIIEE